jgi:hypothetical protein
MDRTSYNTDGDALRPSGSGAQPGGYRKVGRVELQEEVVTPLGTTTLTLMDVDAEFTVNTVE